MLELIKKLQEQARLEGFDVEVSIKSLANNEAVLPRHQEPINGAETTINEVAAVVEEIAQVAATPVVEAQVAPVATPVVEAPVTPVAEAVVATPVVETPVAPAPAPVHTPAPEDVDVDSFFD